MPTRRHLLTGLLGGTTALCALPWRASSQEQGRHLVIVVVSGGWDATFALDPKLGLPDVDGPEPDVDPGDPLDREELALVSGHVLAANERKRPAVTEFFEAYGDRATVINGIWTGSIAHRQSLVRLLTGTQHATAPDMAMRVALEHGSERPLGIVDLSGHGLPGPAPTRLARAGARNQLKALLDADHASWRVPAAYEIREPLEVTPRDDTELHDWLSARTEALRGTRSDPRGILDDHLASLGRARHLWEGGKDQMAAVVAGNAPDLLSDAALAGQLLSEGTCQAVILDSRQHWDVHADAIQQHHSWNRLFFGLQALAAELDARGLQDRTTVAVLSELGRTPRRNGQHGTDHWPYTSALVWGAGVAGGRVCGATDDSVVGAPIDLATGAPSSTGATLRYDSVVAGILAACDVDPAEALPGVEPLGGLLA